MTSLKSTIQIVLITVLAHSSWAGLPRPSSNHADSRNPNQAPDGSKPALDVNQAFAIAKREVLQKEKWVEEKRIPNKPTLGILMTAHRIDQGGWRITAAQGLFKNGKDGGGGAVYKSTYRAIVTVDRTATVKSYALADIDAED